MIAQIRPADLAAWLAQVQTHLAPGTHAIVLDVREPWELALASVKVGKLHPQQFELCTIPMNDIPQRMVELDKARPIACLCHHGMRSQHVAELLAQNGFQVVNIDGGIDAWAQEIDPTLKQY